MSPPDTPLLVDAALAVTALVFVAAFTLLWSLNAKVGVLCDPDNGVIKMLAKLTEKVDGTVTDVALLKLRTGAIETRMDRLESD